MIPGVGIHGGDAAHVALLIELAVGTIRRRGWTLGSAAVVLAHTGDEAGRALAFACGADDRAIVPGTFARAFSLRTALILVGLHRGDSDPALVRQQLAHHPGEGEVRVAAFASCRWSVSTYTTHTTRRNAA